jgi:hypothetical protein
MHVLCSRSGRHAINCVVFRAFRLHRREEKQGGDEHIRVIKVDVVPRENCKWNAGFDSEVFDRGSAELQTAHSNPKRSEVSRASAPADDQPRFPATMAASGHDFSAYQHVSAATNEKSGPGGFRKRSVKAPDVKDAGEERLGRETTPKSFDLQSRDTA